MGASQRPADLVRSPGIVVVQRSVPLSFIVAQALEPAHPADLLLLSLPHAALTRTTSRERGDILPAPLSRDHLDIARADFGPVQTYFVAPQFAVASTEHRPLLIAVA